MVKSWQDVINILKLGNGHHVNYGGSVYVSRITNVQRFRNNELLNTYTKDSIISHSHFAGDIVMRYDGSVILNPNRFKVHHITASFSKHGPMYLTIWRYNAKGKYFSKEYTGRAMWKILYMLEDPNNWSISEYTSSHALIRTYSPVE